MRKGDSSAWDGLLAADEGILLGLFVSLCAS